MSYYDDFDEEQRMMFESDPMITGQDRSSGCLTPIITLVAIILFSIVISNL